MVLSEQREFSYVNLESERLILESLIVNEGQCCSPLIGTAILCVLFRLHRGDATPQTMIVQPLMQESLLCFI